MKINNLSINLSSKQTFFRKIESIFSLNENIIFLSSILFDEYGYFATSCNNNKFYLLFANGTNTGKLMVTPTSTRYIGLDSKGHFIQISEKKITIYN